MYHWSVCEGLVVSSWSSRFQTCEQEKKEPWECCTKYNERSFVADTKIHTCSVEFSFDEQFWVFGILKSGSRDFTTMRNTWLSPRSAIWEYWTSLIACLFWIQYSYGMPHVIRIGKLITFKFTHTRARSDAQRRLCRNLESCSLFRSGPRPRARSGGGQCLGYLSGPSRSPWPLSGRVWI